MPPRTVCCCSDLIRHIRLYDKDKLFRLPLLLSGCCTLHHLLVSSSITNFAHCYLASCYCSLSLVSFHTDSHLPPLFPRIVRPVNGLAWALLFLDQLLVGVNRAGAACAGSATLICWVVSGVALQMQPPRSPRLLAAAAGTLGFQSAPSAFRARQHHITAASAAAACSALAVKASS